MEDDDDEEDEGTDDEEDDEGDEAEEDEDEEEEEEEEPKPSKKGKQKKQTEEGDTDVFLSEFLDDEATGKKRKRSHRVMSDDGSIRDVDDKGGDEGEDEEEEKQVKKRKQKSDAAKARDAMRRNPLRNQTAFRLLAVTDTKGKVKSHYLEKTKWLTTYARDNITKLSGINWDDPQHVMARVFVHEFMQDEELAGSKTLAEIAAKLSVIFSTPDLTYLLSNVVPMNAPASSSVHAPLVDLLSCQLTVDKNHTLKTVPWSYPGHPVVRVVAAMANTDLGQVFRKPMADYLDQDGKFGDKHALVKLLIIWRFVVESKDSGAAEFVAAVRPDPQQQQAGAKSLSDL